MAELGALRGRLGLPVERDLWFEATHPLSVYAEASGRAGRIVTDSTALEEAAKASAD